MKHRLRISSSLADIFDPSLAAGSADASLLAEVLGLL